MPTYTQAHAFQALGEDQNPYPQLASLVFHLIQRHFATMLPLQLDVTVSSRKAFEDQTSLILYFPSFAYDFCLRF
jgi:hypothetical protein